MLFYFELKVLSSTGFQEIGQSLKEVKIPDFRPLEKSNFF